MKREKNASGLCLFGFLFFEELWTWESQEAVRSLSALLSLLQHLSDPQGCCLVLFVRGPPACLKDDAEPHGSSCSVSSQSPC